MNILLIDDDEDTIFLMGVLFRKFDKVEHYTIETTGRKALSFLEKCKKMPDCIFVDLKMPEMGGFEFVETFERLYGEKYPQTRLYILSSSAGERDHNQAISYKSVEEFILKPLTKKKLSEIFEAFQRSNTNDDDATDNMFFFNENSSPVCFINSDDLRPEYKNQRI